MTTSRTRRSAALLSVGALAVGAVATVVPAHAAPGDWVNVSGIAATSGYPEISTSAVPALAIYGNDVQVMWSRSDATNSTGLYTGILDKNAAVKTASTPVVTGWQSTSGNPQLLSYQGQRAVSFGGNQGGSGRGQNLATSADGITWTVNPGSLSATNLANVSSGGGTVNSSGEVLIWGGAPNMGSFVWHVGLSATNPADTPDQVYSPASGARAVNIVYEASTGATYGAYFTRSSDPTLTGTHYAQIHPTFTGFTQVPGSYVIDDAGSPQATESGAVVPMAARPQGGVFVGYIDKSDGDSLKIREIGTGRVMVVPGSTNAEGVSLSAAPNGRLWVTFEKSSQMFVSQTDPGAKAFGAAAAWGSPQSGASIYSAAIAGDSASAYVGINAYAAGEQNMYATSVLPNLTVQVVGAARKGALLKVRVLDGGAPVRNARVTVGGKTLKTKAGGLASFKAPRSSSVKVVAKGPGYRDGAATITLR